MALDVNVTIKLSEAGGSVGFGVPLILVSKAESAIAYREFSDLDELPDAGYAETTTAYKLFRIMKMQNNKPKMIAVAQVTGKADAALANYKGKVRQIVAVLGEDDSTAAEVAAYVETTDSMTYFPIVSSASDLAALKSYDRTFAGVHSAATQDLAAAVVGATAGLEAGSFTYKNLIIKGVDPDALSESEINTIDNTSKSAATGYGYTLQAKAGDIVTTEGRAASGEFLDITDSFDWIIQNIEYRCQKALNSEPKLPYDNRGISVLEAQTNGVLKEADNMGIIAHDDADVPVYATDFGPRSEASAADRAERAYKLGRFSFELAGAIHTAQINGAVTV